VLNDLIFCFAGGQTAATIVSDSMLFVTRFCLREVENS